MPKHAVQFLLFIGHILFLSPPLFSQDIALTPEEAEVIETQQADLDGLQIDLNTATQTDLLTLPDLPPEMAWRIVAFRPYRTLEDLHRVPGLSTEDIERLMPYLITDHPRQWQSKITARISRPTGAPNQANQMRFLERLQWALPHTASALLIIERDPKEPAWNDFVTGHVTLNLPHTHLVLGDLRPHFGQGLILSRHTRTTANLASASPNPTRLEGNRTSTEYGALRGGLMATSYKQLTLTALYGRAQWDADLEGDIPELRLSGLHDSQTTQARKGSLHEQSTALNIHLGTPQTHLSLTALKTNLSPNAPIEASPRQISLGGQWQRTQVTLFGETALTTQDNAYLMGAQMRFPNIRIHLLGRRYGPQYQSLHSASFATFGTPPNNEWGIFGGMSWRTSTRSRLEFSLDRHGRLIPQSTPLPERGERIRLSLQHRLQKNLTVKLATDTRTRTAQTTRRGLRADLTGRHRALHWTIWTTKIQAGVSGYATGTRLRLTLPANIILTGWTTFFHIPNYDARIYAFEPDVWGGGRLLTLSGHGRADGLLITFKTAFIRIATRYSIRTTKTERRTSWSLQLELNP